MNNNNESNLKLPNWKRGDKITAAQLNSISNALQSVSSKRHMTKIPASVPQGKFIKPRYYCKVFKEGSDWKITLDVGSKRAIGAAWIDDAVITEYLPALTSDITYYVFFRYKYGVCGLWGEWKNDDDNGKTIHVRASNDVPAENLSYRNVIIAQFDTKTVNTEVVPYNVLQRQFSDIEIYEVQQCG